MNKSSKSEEKKNPFKKILDDAGRSLDGIGNYGFLDNLPRPSDTEEPCVPFPYGSQPESKTGWK